MIGRGRVARLLGGVVVASMLLVMASAPGRAAAAIVTVADSHQDWLDYAGGSGATGVPQQNHPDLIGSGAWSYNRGNSATTHITALVFPVDHAGDGTSGNIGGPAWQNAAGPNYGTMALFSALGAPANTGGTIDGWVVRRWTSGVAGTVNISGFFMRDQTGQNSGHNSTVELLLDWTAGVIPLALDASYTTTTPAQTTINGDDTVTLAGLNARVEFDFDLVVSIGTTLDFVMMATPTDGSFDSMQFETLITQEILEAAAVPEPATLGFLAIAGLLTRRQRRAAADAA